MIHFRCPHCDALLQSPDGTMGTKCLCPKCGQQLAVPQAPPVLARAAPDGLSRPIGNGRRQGPGDKYCPDCGAPLRARAEICPECGVPQPRRGWGYKRRLRRDLEPHRGTLIMVLGILSLFTAPFILGPIAWVLGTEDLRKIRAGRMDPEGESMTSTGKVCGMVATIVSLVILAGVVLVWLFCIGTFMTAFGAAQRGW
jgi:hypothetical protein